MYILQSRGSTHTQSLLHWAAPPGLHRPAQTPLCQAMPPRPAKLAIHRHSRSPPGHALSPAQASTISTGLLPLRLQRPAQSPPGLSTKAYQASNPDTQDLHSAGPCPSGMPGLCSKGPLVSLNQRPPTIGPWDPTHLPPITGQLETCLRDTHREDWMLKE
jgi:hypothetical protein